MGYTQCSRTYTDVLPCCINYYRQNNICLPCLTGSFGFNCTSRCKPGWFGESCAGVCEDCTPEDCHYHSGCPKHKYVTPFEKEETSIFSTVSSPLPSNSENESVESSQASLTLILVVAGVIIILMLVILLAVLRKLRVMHMERNYWKNKIESKYFKKGNEEDKYQEIDIDCTMVHHDDVSGSHYNIIMEELDQPLRSRSQYSGSEINKEGTSTYSHYHEIDNENSSSNGNNGGYVEPKSRTYTEVIEPMIHASDPANSDENGSNSNKSDQDHDLYQDTMNIRTSDKSCSDNVNGSKPHDSSMSDTYLDVVHDLL